LLARAGAVADCERGDGRCLTDEFRDAWRNRIAGLRGDDAARAAFASLRGIDPDRLSFETFGGAYVALLDRREAGQWPSRGAFLADVAAAETLDGRHDGWADLDGRSRGRVLGELCRFLDRCPSCDGPLETGEAVVESCCRSDSTRVVAVTCRECGARVYEAETTA
jgi:hypothetical protein